MLKEFKAGLDDLFGLFFPNLCPGCGQHLYRGEEVICSLCRFHLPKTYFHNDPDNPLQRVFWGRVSLESAAAYVYFQKGGTVQRLMHLLKYRNRPDIGREIGKWYGHDLFYSQYFRGIDLVVPVPLHPRKESLRGYNQSLAFAEGLAIHLKAPVEAGCLYRQQFSQTQTRKARYDRWENVEHIFAVRKAVRLEGKYILLVDDVVTTGATLEACAHALLAVKGVKISVATMAYASF